MRKEVLQIDKIEGPLIILSEVEDVSYGEIIDIIVEDNIIRKGKVVKIEKDKVLAEVFEGTSGLSTKNTRLDLQEVL